MALLYGVLRARPDRIQREDGQDTPHLQLRVVDDTGQAWRIAINVQSGDLSFVVFWVVDPLAGHPILSALPTVASGFTVTEPNSSQSLDYVKAPLFDVSDGRALPPTGTANADDLQDLLTLYVDQCSSAGGELYAFGARFTENLGKPIDAEFGIPDGLHGIHDIHMNQGNVDSHLDDNGAYHDGGLLIAMPDRVVGFFMAFQSQAVPTDDVGAAAANAQRLSALIAGLPAGPSSLYLERALINPLGANQGHEVVVVGNCASEEASLAGWQLVDRAGRTTALDGSVAGGASIVIPLDGSGVQLGNGGGNLLLRDADGNLADSVSYAWSDADREGRFFRFRR